MSENMAMDLSALEPSDALPFGDWDVNEVATRLERNWIARLLKGRKIAELLRDLWHSGHEQTEKLITVEGAFDHLLNVEMPAKIKRAKERATKAAQELGARIDLVTKEAAQFSVKGRGRTRTVPDIAVVVSEEQFLLLGGDSICPETKRKATTGERYAWTYKGWPIYSAAGVHGPVAVTMDTLAAMKASPALVVRER